MKPADIVKQYVAALETGDVDRAAGFLSDDFEVAGLTPLSIPRWQYVETLRGLLSAFPDLRFNLRDVHEEAGLIKATVHITGTQERNLVVPVPDLPSVPATGKCISLPDETQTFTVRGNKIASLRVSVSPGGGFQGLYRQLGARLPVPSAITG
ncbi:MAG: ester cyclase [Sphingomonadaceae bacterium]